MTPTDVEHEYRRWRSDHPGNPLGRGYPLGAPLRLDGESHLAAWMRISRGDPCAYCGQSFAGTADHIEPKSQPVRGFGGAHCWLNITGACADCNGRKGARPMLRFLTNRALSRPRRARLVA